MKIKKATYFSFFFLFSFLASFAVNIVKTQQIQVVSLAKIITHSKLEIAQKNEESIDGSNLIFEENENELDFEVQDFLIQVFIKFAYAYKEKAKNVHAYANPSLTYSVTPIYLKNHTFRI